VIVDAVRWRAERGECVALGGEVLGVGEQWAAYRMSDVILPAPTSARRPAGFINEPALLAMVDTVYSRVGHSLRTGRFPLPYVADCAVLLAAIPALRNTTDRAGLLFVDAHEDATTMEQSDTGEAANMEIALLLGLTGRHASEPLQSL
jgi:arginase